MTEMVSSATEFVRSGFSEEDSAQLAQVAELYRNVADAEISSAESAQFITSQIKAFNLDANDAITILDQLNAVSNNYAVSSTDIATALSKTSSAMATLGNTSQETIGLVTAGTEQLTGQASKVAKGLRTIGLNIAKTATDSGELNYQIGNTTKNISLLDKSTGDMKSTFQVLSEIAEDWDKMSNAEKTAIGQTLAGKNQYEVFSAVLNQFDDAISATQTALDSQGSAMNENSKYMESMGAKLNALKAQFQELVLGDGGLNKFLKGLIDLGTGILKFTNSDLGQVIIKVGVFVTAILVLNKAIQSTTATNIIQWAKDFVVAMSMATDSTIGLNGALELLNINPVMLAITALAAVVVGGLAIAKKANDELDNNISKLSEMSSAYSDATKEVESLKSQLKNINSKIEEINSLDGVKITREGELSELERQREELEQTLILQREIAEQAEKDLETQASKTVRGNITDTKEIFGLSDYYNLPQETYSNLGINISDDLDRVEVLKLVSNEMLNQQKVIDGLIQKKKENNGLSEEEQNALNDSIDKYNEARGIGATYSEELDKEIVGLSETSETRNYATEGLDAYSEALKSTTKETGEATNNIYEFSDSEKEQEKETNQATEALQAYNDALAELSSMGDSFDVLNNSIAEYNSSGEFTLDTLSNLLALGDDYLSLLQFENGQLSLNKDGALALANAKIDEAEATAVQKAMAELNALAQNDEASAIDNASESASASYNANMTAVSGANQAIIACNKGVTAWNNYWSAQSKTTISNGANASKANEIGKSLNNQIKSLESLRGNLGKVTTATESSTSATKGNTSATKSNTDALKERQEVLKDTVDDYKEVINYINSKLDDQIDKLKDLKDTALDTIDTQIDALSEQRDAEEQFWNDKIDALNAENDAIEDQLELQDLLNNLMIAQSKKVKVYKEGQGFVYDVDQSEVDKARQSLEEYNRKKKLKDQIAELEKNRDDKLKIYDQQIDDLENYAKQVEADYDNQIKYYQDWKDRFKDQVNAYENEQNRLKALELTGIDFENENWITRLDNLSNFVNKYKEYQQELAKITEQINKSSESSTQSSPSGGGGGSNYSSSSVSEEPKEKYTVFKILSKHDRPYDANISRQHYGDKADGVLNYGGKYVVYKKTNEVFSNENDARNKAGSFSIASQGKEEFGYKQFASGTPYVDENGMAIVGENPNKEIVIGSKLNNGVAMNLSKGSGVVNAKSTNTLAGIFNSLKSFNQLNPNDRVSNGISINIENVSLPNVSNPKDFVKGINELAVQKAYRMI